ncbi:MAG: DUF3298 domain-containing protein [Lachnospiraceae bacterium]|nr:DUF3298 domain-containing protein [Lachnospiraceae bacterium]
MKRRVIALLMTMSLAAAVLSGCGSAVPATQTSAAPAATEAAPAATEAAPAATEAAPAATEAATEAAPAATEEELDPSVNNIDQDALKQDFIKSIENSDYEDVKLPEDKDIQITVVSDYKNYESLEYLTYLFFGANGINYAQYYTADRGTGDVITLDQLVKSDQATYDAISDNIRSQMEEQMQQDDTVKYFTDDFKGVDKDSLWYLGNDGSLIITFPEATIAPHSDGIINFTIPSDVFDPTKVL